MNRLIRAGKDVIAAKRDLGDRLSDKIDEMYTMTEDYRLAVVEQQVYIQQLESEIASIKQAVGDEKDKCSCEIKEGFREARTKLRSMPHETLMDFGDVTTYTHSSFNRAWQGKLEKWVSRCVMYSQTITLQM